MFLGAAKGLSRLKWLTKAEPWLLRRGLSAEAAVADFDEHKFNGVWKMTESAEAVPGFQDLWSQMKDALQPEDVVQEWKNQGNTLSKELIDSSLLKLCSQAQFSRARRLINWVKREKTFELTEKDKMMMLHIATRLMGSSSKVGRVLKTMQPKSEVPYVLALKVYVGEMYAEKAEKLFEEMKASNLIVTANAYTLMLRLYVKKNDKAKALKIFEEYEASGLPPDPAMCWFLLSNKEQIFDSLKVEDMARAALREVEITPLNRRDVMRCYTYLGDIEGFNRVWEEVLKNPPVVPADFMAVISCCSIMGNVEKAEEVSSCYRKDQLNYNHALALLRLYAMHGKMEKALEMQKELLDRKLDFELFHPIIEGYLKLGQVEKAAECFHSFEVREGRGPIAWRLIVDAIVKLNKEFALTGDVKSAEKLMTSLPRKHADVAFKSLLRVYLGAGLPGYGLKERMLANNVSIEDEEIKTLLSQFENA